jgi:redox-sensitive bicupin YhaK (pirin superfamily)
MSIRPVLETRPAVPTMEGAGVHLHRAFGFQDPSELDPFLLFDDFRNDLPAHFEKVSHGTRTAASKPLRMC